MKPMKFLNILFVVAIFFTAKLHAEERNELQFNFGAQHFAGKSFYPDIVDRSIPNDLTFRYIRMLNDEWGIGGEYSFNTFDITVSNSDFPINLSGESQDHSHLDASFSFIGARYIKLKNFRFGVMALVGLNGLSTYAPSTNYLKSATTQETIKYDFSEEGNDLVNVKFGLLLNATFYPFPKFGIGLETGYQQYIGSYDIKVSTTNCFRPDIVYPDQILRRRNPGYIPIRLMFSFRF